MRLGEHFKTAGGAVSGWLVAQLMDSLAVGLLWFVGLLLVKMSWPLALLWALVGMVCQFIPHLGPVLGLIGPAMTAAARVTSSWEHAEQLIYVLILYAVIMVVDGLFLQPYFMRRKTKVPIWASILTPLVLGFVVPFWGILLAPPLLAVVYAFKAKREKRLDEGIMRLSGDETLLVGSWQLSGGRMIADDTLKRIEALVRDVLVPIALANGGWDKLFRDPGDSRYWELTYPQGAGHGGGPPTLSVLSEDSARHKYEF